VCDRTRVIAAHADGNDSAAAAALLADISGAVRDEVAQVRVIAWSIAR
jgi:hypothetical protein